MPLADDVCVVPAFDAEAQPASAYLDKFDGRPYLHSDRRRRTMAQVHVDTDGVLTGRKIGTNGLDAGRLNESH